MENTLHEKTKHEGAVSELAVGMLMRIENEEDPHYQSYRLWKDYGGDAEARWEVFREGQMELALRILDANKSRLNGQHVIRLQNVLRDYQ